MGKCGVVTFVLVGSILGGEAMGEIGKHGLYWLPDHTHVEIPDTDAGAYRRTVSEDSGVTATATGTMNFLKSLGLPFIIVAPDV